MNTRIERWLNCVCKGPLPIRNERYRFVDWVFENSLYKVLFVAFAIYFGIAIFFGGIYWGIQEFTNLRIVTGQENQLAWWKYFHFSLLIQTTLGYGDYTIVHAGKVLCLIQAAIRLIMISLVIPLVIVKLWAPGDAIVFADEAELREVQCKNKNKKAMIFRFRCVNTHKVKLRDVKAICFFAGRNPENSEYEERNEELRLYYEHLPYMGKSVWYFHTRGEKGEKDEYGEKGEKDDLFKLVSEQEKSERPYRIKVLITGMYGHSPYSAIKVYEQNNLINGRYKEIPGEPDKSIEFDRDFHLVNSSLSKVSKKK